MADVKEISHLWGGRWIYFKSNVYCAWINWKQLSRKVFDLLLICRMSDFSVQCSADPLMATFCWMLCFGGAPHIFQMEYLTNMSGTVELLDIWEMTTTLLMWPWPVRMISRWKLTRWSWLGRSSLLNYLKVNITSKTSTLTSWSISTVLSSRQEAAAAGEPMLSCHISPSQVRVYQLPVGVDGLASLA